MADKSAIEWCDATWNPTTGCSHVSAGCEHCYAESITARFRKDHKPWTAANAKHNVVLHPDRLEIPLHWRKPRRIFVNSMSDLFHEDVPDDFILDVFRMMQRVNRHDYQVLTKRYERMRDFMRRLGQEDGVLFLDHLAGGMSPHLPNVWLGGSVSNQKDADIAVPIILQTPWAAVRFVSYEPALGPVDFEPYLNFGRIGEKWDSLDWIIAGGESGPGARPSHPDWFRSVRDQCQAAGVPFLFKQWGEWDSSYPQHVQDPPPFEFPDGMRMWRVGKKSAGRLLDGREWSEFPEAVKNG